MIALWRYATTGVVPAGAILKTAVRMRVARARCVLVRWGAAAFARTETEKVPPPSCPVRDCTVSGGRARRACPDRSRGRGPQARPHRRTRVRSDDLWRDQSTRGLTPTRNIEATESTEDETEKTSGLVPPTGRPSGRGRMADASTGGAHPVFASAILPHPHGAELRAARALASLLSSPFVSVDSVPSMKRLFESSSMSPCLFPCLLMRVDLWESGLWISTDPHAVKPRCEHLGAVGRSRAAFYSRSLVILGSPRSMRCAPAGWRHLRDDHRVIKDGPRSPRRLVASPPADPGLPRDQGRLKHGPVAPDRKQNARQATREGDHRDAPPATRRQLLSPGA